jgi:hypothetical protein
VDLDGSGKGLVTGCCEYGDEPRSSDATDLVRTSKRTRHFITQIKWLILFTEIIAVYTENHTKQIQTQQLVTAKAGGTYSSTVSHLPHSASMACSGTALQGFK